MSLKSGCFVGYCEEGVNIYVVTHEELWELRRDCYYRPSVSDTKEPENESEDKWMRLFKAQNAKYLDRRYE